MFQQLKRRRILLYVLLGLIIIDIILYIVLSATNVLNQRHTLEIIFAVTTPAVIFAWAILLVNVIQLKEMVKQLNYDNKYYLGRTSKFYNYQIFQKDLLRIAYKPKNSNAYLVSFTACKQEVSSNLSRNDAVTKLTYLISEMLIEYFHKEKMKHRKDVLYCLSKDGFLLYIVCEEEKINSIIKEFEFKIYEIAKENEIRLFIQPFFGISNYDVKEPLNVNVENASLARRCSEKNFELATYFNNDLRYQGNINEAKEMIDAINNKEFVVYYQPKFHLESKRFISSEALIRWDSKKYGLLPPSRFIAKAEAAGLIHDIDMYVFTRVCNDLNEFKKRGRRMIPVSINFSLYEFYSPSFVEDIIRIIDENNVSHNLIEIEITETTSQSNPFLSISIMKKLKDKGIRVLMDDFGVGFSNFNNLRKMPIDSLKIDKSFIDDIVSDSKTREIVKFLISLAKVNGLEAIAEGVDNKEQVEILRKAKLDTIQGFYYSKPLSKKDYEAFLLDNPFEKKGGDK